MCTVVGNDSGSMVVQDVMRSKIELGDLGGFSSSSCMSRERLGYFEFICIISRQ